MDVTPERFALIPLQQIALLQKKLLEPLESPFVQAIPLHSFIQF
jgi:hypothetical protein